MKVTKTPRGFELIQFADSNGDACSLQQSSATDFERGPGQDYLWLGRDSARMHLDRDAVKELLPHLKRWANTGSLRTRRSHNCLVPGGTTDRNILGKNPDSYMDSGKNSTGNSIGGSAT